MFFPISGIVITKNEEENIACCLSSLSWLEEVIVVDSGSTDKTIEVIQKFPNTKLIEHRWLGFVETKKLAIKQASHPWILWLDADESISAELRKEIQEIFVNQTHLMEAFDGFEMKRRTYFLGQWIQHCSWYPSWILRLFRHESIRFSKSVLHESVQVSSKSRVYKLSNDIDHYSYPSLEKYFLKMVLYGKYSAHELEQRGYPVRLYDMILRPLFAFLRSYFLKRGFQDGLAGLIISVGTGFSVFIKYTSFYVMRKRRGRFVKRL